ncbi:DNA-binding protein [Dysgonomonas capnocytophagoides]|uniref:DNA-binding protein n=1 Tax=Dysgonomonas capnocytophagoides TaxID=45254 RepID=A0A4Y8L5P8_9BACT|nr:helix-turn-helix domain-containing protein [Dysgonomonas capnocytophagoides]TFD96400.1 DNA-binding protein [Dysgonomonas capnocytophagoides]
MNMDFELRPTCDISLKTWLNEKELMVYISLSQPKVREARESKGLPFFDLMGRIMYERTAVDAWIRKESKKSGISRK